jgi:hypothetical protein
VVVSILISKNSILSVIPLDLCWIRDLPDVTNVLTNSFQLVTEENTYTFFTKTREEKLDWIKKLENQINTLIATNPSLKDNTKFEKSKKFKADFDDFNEFSRSIYGITFKGQPK